MIDLKKFKFKATSLYMPTDRALLQEAIDRGFYNGHTKYNDLFTKLFFKGGALNYKTDIDTEFKKKAFNYLRCFMGSMEPKHKEKEAICALILSELDSEQ